MINMVLNMIWRVYIYIYLLDNDSSIDKGGYLIPFLSTFPHTIHDSLTE